MKQLVVVLALLALGGCKKGNDADWKDCFWLGIYERPDQHTDDASVALLLARYRIVRTNPLTVEYEGQIKDRVVSGVTQAHHVKCE